MRVKFTKFGSNSQVGGFGPGDFANVSDVLAAHLVNDAGVAVYADEVAAAPAPAPRSARAPAPAKTGRSRKA